MLQKIIIELIKGPLSIFASFDPNNRRKKRAEAQAMDIENVRNVLKIYQEALEDMGKLNKTLLEELQQEGTRAVQQNNVKNGE